MLTFAYACLPACLPANPAIINHVKRNDTYVNKLLHSSEGSCTSMKLMFSSRRTAEMFSPRRYKKDVFRASREFISTFAEDEEDDEDEDDDERDKALGLFD